MTEPLSYIDGHNDTLLHFVQASITAEELIFGSPETHIDFSRARESGMMAGIFALFTPLPNTLSGQPESDYQLHNKGYSSRYAPSIDFDYACQFAIDALKKVNELERKFPDHLRIIKKKEDFLRLGDAQIGVILHLEGAEPVRRDMSNLELLYELGVRSIGPLWSRKNVFGSGVQFGFPLSPDSGPGLTEHGINLVRRCNEMGVMVDTAHMNLASFMDVARVSQKPLVCSHSACYALANSSRNLLDEQIDAVSSSNGVIGINFAVYDLRDDGQLILDHSLDLITSHIDYIVKRGGPECVSLGSDLDGTIVAQDISDVSCIPMIFERLEAMGYSMELIKLIAMDNWLRVFNETF